MGYNEIRLKVILLCSLGFCVYLFVILSAGTVPISDFRGYFERAMEILQGSPLSNQYKYFSAGGYPYLLAGVFRFFGTNSILLPQILNALSLTLLLWLYLKSPLANFSFGVLVGYFIMIFNVNYLGMVTVLCTEIPYALFFLTGLLSFRWGLKEMFGSRSESPRGVFLLFVISGLFLGVSQFIRAVTFTYVVIFSLVMVVGHHHFVLEGGRRGWKPVLLTSLRTLGLTWLTFFTVALLLYRISGYGLTYMPLQKGLWNLFIGFNIETKGSWDSRDIELIDKLGHEHDWDAGRMNRDFKPIVLNRIKKSWIKNLQILPDKLYKLLNPRDIYFWSTAESNVVDKGKISKTAGYLSWLNGLVLLFCFGTWGLWLSKGKFLTEEFFAFCAMGAVFVYLLLHAYFLEVQARYSSHMWMVLFWCFPRCLQVLWRPFYARASLVKGKRRVMGPIMIGVGIIVLFVSLFADFLGIGGFPGFGKKQAAGAGIGIGIVVAGLILNRKPHRVC